MRPGLFTLVLALTTSPVVARADEPTFGPAYGPANDPSPPASASANSKWYGLPMLVSDLVSAAIWSATVVSSSTSGPDNPAEQASVLALFPYLITSPVVHALHGHGWRAVGSVALRLVLPTAGFVIGGLAATCPPPPGVVPSGIEYCDSLDIAFKGALVGSGIAAVLAMVIDDAALTWEPPDEPAPAKASLRPPALQWLPTLGVAHDSGNNAVPTFGVAGSF